MFTCKLKDPTAISLFDFKLKYPDGHGITWVLLEVILSQFLGKSFTWVISNFILDIRWIMKLGTLCEGGLYYRGKRLDTLSGSILNLLIWKELEIYLSEETGEIIFI